MGLGYWLHACWVTRMSPALEHHAYKSQRQNASVGPSLGNSAPRANARQGSRLLLLIPLLRVKNTGGLGRWEENKGGSDAINTLHRQSTGRRMDNGTRNRAQTLVFWFCSRNPIGNEIQCIYRYVGRQSENKTRKWVCWGFQVKCFTSSSSPKLAKQDHWFLSPSSASL